MKDQPVRKRYIVRKYVIAGSAMEALKLERGFAPDDVFIDDKWIDTQGKEVGFSSKPIK